LNSHANDPRALGDLAVADFYLDDHAGAVAALEKGGTVAPNFKAIPINAYADYVNDQVKAGDFTSASAAAKKLVALQPTYNTENTLGFTELSAKNFADAVTDLQKARDDATTAKADAKTTASIDLNLEQALVGAGKIDDAKKLAPEIAQLDPARASASQNVLAQYYSDAGTAKVNAKAFADAATLYEQAAADVPSFASQFYTSAAFMYLQLQPMPDNTKAKADADKAIAADATNAKANYAAGIALANDGKTSDALTYLKKADDLAKAATPPNAAFVTQVETAIAQVSKAK
jgi:tetratricopeptide (TPR) repeat protein